MESSLKMRQLRTKLRSNRSVITYLRDDNKKLFARCKVFGLLSSYGVLVVPVGSDPQTYNGPSGYSAVSKACTDAELQQAIDDAAHNFSVGLLENLFADDNAEADYELASL